MVSFELSYFSSNFNTFFFLIIFMGYQWTIFFFSKRRPDSEILQIHKSYLTLEIVKQDTCPKHSGYIKLPFPSYKYVWHIVSSNLLFPAYNYVWHIVSSKLLFPAYNYVWHIVSSKLLFPAYNSVWHIVSSKLLFPAYNYMTHCVQQFTVCTLVQLYLVYISHEALLFYVLFPLNSCEKFLSGVLQQICCSFYCFRDRRGQTGTIF